MKYGATLAALLLIAGCTTTPKQSVTEPVTDATQLRDWYAQGRMGVSGVAQAGSGSFSWQQHGEVSQVNLHGPLGAGAVSLLLDTALHVTFSNGIRYDADDALRELELRLGAAVPVKQLSYWLRGVPAPGDYQWREDGKDGKRSLQQDNWTIEYDDSVQVEVIQLPRKITATHDAARIRVVIESWKLQ